jgi:hypothetical protein
MVIKMMKCEQRCAPSQNGKILRYCNFSPNFFVFQIFVVFLF